MLENKDKNLTKLENLGEFNLIDLLTKDLKIKHKSTIKAIGDDAAVWKFGKKQIAISCDSQIENIHFSQKFSNLKKSYHLLKEIKNFLKQMKI